MHKQIPRYCWFPMKSVIIFFWKLNWTLLNPLFSSLSVCISDSPINRQRFYTGDHHIDEICCKTGLTPAKIQVDIEGDPFVVTLCKWLTLWKRRVFFRADLVVVNDKFLSYSTKQRYLRTIFTSKMRFNIDLNHLVLLNSFLIYKNGLNSFLAKE